MLKGAWKKIYVHVVTHNIKMKQSRLMSTPIFLSLYTNQLLHILIILPIQPSLIMLNVTTWQSTLLENIHK